MRALLFIALALISSAPHAGPALMKPDGLQMAFAADRSSLTGGPDAYDVQIAIEGENGGLLTGGLFERWWGCEIAPLSGGETLRCTVVNFTSADLILPVWSTSTDGETFTAPARIPGEVVDNLMAQPQEAYDFTVAVPDGVTHVRLWKYFPYTIDDKLALLASLPPADPEGPVRFSGPIGESTEGRPIEMIELSRGADDAGKHRVWIHSGIHCAETTSYFVVEGLIDFLLNSGEPDAQRVLERCIIDVVPMLNPDGVARGNYRASAPNPPSRPGGTDMEFHFGDRGEWQSSFSECQTVMDQIRRWNGTPPEPPTANPVEVILNLHATHEEPFPTHYQHSPTYPPTGVLPAVHALEGVWIDAFKGRSPDFVGRGTTLVSRLGSRSTVEGWAHDLYPANAAHDGPPIMAITYEASYQGGPVDARWNTADDYRQNGREMALALLDYFDRLESGAVPPGRH